MKNGKYSARRSGSKVLVLALAMVLLVTATVGGTLAWLTDKTDEVKNTFTTAGIKIELIETMQPDGTVSNTAVTNWSAKIIPGYTYSKNPKVTVKEKTTEDIWLFVKFVATEDTNNALTYTSTLSAENSGWTQGTGTDKAGNGVPTNVWYRVVKATDTTKSWELLKDNKVTISGDLTKDKMPTSNLELKYTAYAHQLWKSNDSTKTEAENQFTAAEAWGNVSKLDTSTSTPTT